MSSFASVRSQAVSLETQASGLLSKYSSYALSTSSEATGEETKLEKKIEQTLHKVSKCDCDGISVLTTCVL